MRSAGRSWLLLTGFLLFYVIYLLFGALVFSSLERPLEERLRREVRLLKQDFLNRSCVSAASLDTFLRRVLHAQRLGVTAHHNQSEESGWDLASSLFFVNTLVTTVGYGHTSPQSDPGKFFSVVYALLGVPFTMLVLTACVQRLMHPLVFAPVGVLLRLGLEPRPATVVHFLLLLLVVVLCFFIVPAAIFSTLEVSWSFLDSIYFCFISLSTVGLGDLVPGNAPGQKYRALYQISVIVYLFLGLMMMYLLLTTLHKMADQHGLTTFLQLPRYEGSDADDEHRPIVDEGQAPPPLPKAADTPLEPGRQPSYNSINKG